MAALILMLAAEPVRSEDRAIVVGIDDYPALKITLTGAVADAQRFESLLIASWGFEPGQVTLLLGQAATSDRILTAITEELIGRTRPGDRVVFYFAGLGTWIAADSGSGRRALVAHDTESLLGRLPEDLLTDSLDLIPDRDVAVLIDAGFAGLPGLEPPLAMRGLGPEPKGPTNGALFGQGLAVRDVWNAAGAGSFAWEEGGAGLFTSAFLAGETGGAADADGDREISDAELLTFVRDRTESWCQATPACAGAGPGFSPAFSDTARTFVAQQTPGVSAPRSALPEEPPDSFPEAAHFASEVLVPLGGTQIDSSPAELGALRIGRAASIRLRAQRPGTLVLMDVNAQSGLNVVESGLPIGGPAAGDLALELRATEPAGEGFLLAILLPPDSAAPATLLPEAPAGPSSMEAGRYLHEVAEVLLRLEERDEDSEWSAVVLRYEIVQ